MRRFFINPQDIDGQKCRLTGAQVNHIKNVLRLQPGDPLKLFDSTARVYEAQIVRFEAQVVIASILRSYKHSCDARVQITVAQGYLKDKKMDALIRPLVELGVRYFVPVWAGRSVPRPTPQRLENRIKRWGKLAIEAQKQCGRNIPMKIAPPATFDQMIADSAAYNIKLAFWEKAPALLAGPPAVTSAPSGQLVIMMGPEGGFTRAEMQTAQDAGYMLQSLGPRILRAETATIAACTLCQYLFGDMGKKGLDKKR